MKYLLRCKTFCMAFLILTGLNGTANAEEFLDPEKAFQVELSPGSEGQLHAQLNAAEGYYLYKEKIKFRSLDPGVSLVVSKWPEAKVKQDENFGRVEVYYAQALIDLKAKGFNPGSEPVELNVEVSYQGCADAGLCYPPQTTMKKVRIQASQAVQTGGDESTLIGEALASSSLMVNLLFFFMAGLGLSLTPCVLPMIPILSGIVAGQGSELSRSKGLILSAFYVLGMALTYSLAGVAAGLSGTLISSALQNIWVLGAFSLVFVLLSLSMFGVYELQLPNAIQSSLSTQSGRLKGGKHMGVFLMGALSALIVGPCVAAPLAGALLYIGKTGNALLGGLALFSMALGMGVPLLLVGFAGGGLLPKSGAWMEAVKQFFGVLLLATAIWLVSPVIPGQASLLMWAVLLIVYSLFLGALDWGTSNRSGAKKITQGFAFVGLSWGLLMLMGASMGGQSALQPLQTFSVGSSVTVQDQAKLQFVQVASIEELDGLVRQSDKPVMLDFYADWCVACKEMELMTFSRPAVHTALEPFVLAKADVTANTEAHKALLKRFGLFGPPGIVFIRPDGTELTQLRTIGFKNESDFLAVLKP